MASRTHLLSSVTALSVLFSTAATPAQAADPHPTLPSFELERLQLDPGALGSLVVGTGRTLPAGALRVSLQAHYEQLPMKFSDEWAPTNSDGLVEGRFTVHATAAYGLLPWLQLGVQVPFIAAQEGSSTLDLLPPEGGGALGTPYVGLRAALLRMDAGAPLNLALDLTAGLPVGSEALLGRDAFAFTPRLMFGYMDEGFQVGAEVGLHLRKKQDLTELSQWPESIVGNELRVGATVTSRGGKKTRGEVSALLALPMEGGRPSAEVLIGIRRHLGASGSDIYILGGPGLGNAFDMPTFRILGGISFGSGKVD
ncbi:transporter [Myxococcaceae bacterium GXIMD 01537]